MTTDLDNKAISFLKSTSKGRLKYLKTDQEVRDVVQEAHDLTYRSTLNVSLGSKFSEVNSNKTKRNNELGKEVSSTKISSATSKMASNSKEKSSSNSSHIHCQKLIELEENRKKWVEGRLKTKLEVFESDYKKEIDRLRNERALATMEAIKRAQIISDSAIEMDRLLIQEYEEQLSRAKEKQNIHIKRLDNKIKMVEQQNKEDEIKLKQSRYQSVLVQDRGRLLEVRKKFQGLCENCHPNYIPLLKNPLANYKDTFVKLEIMLKNILEKLTDFDDEDLIKAKNVLSSAENLTFELEKEIENAIMLFQQSQASATAQTLNNSSLPSSASIQIQDNLNKPKSTEQAKPVSLMLSESVIQIKQYEELSACYQEWHDLSQKLVTDTSLKQYRVALMIAATTQINAISNVSGEHLKDKVERLLALLSGSKVNIKRNTISTLTNPFGLHYISLVMVKTIVDQAENQVPGNPDSAFPLASVAVTLWNSYPKFGELLMQRIYTRCPYLLPGALSYLLSLCKTEEEKQKALGYLFSDGKLEDKDHFLKRIGGIVMFYAALIISNPPPGYKMTSHPHGLGHAWQFLARLMKQKPIPSVSATVLLSFLEVLGHSMQAVYGKQFFKLFRLVCSNYLKAIRDVSSDSSGSALSRLESFINLSLRKGSIPEPSGILRNSFWSSTNQMQNYYYT